MFRTSIVSKLTSPIVSKIIFGTRGIWCM